MTAAPSGFNIDRSTTSIGGFTQINTVGSTATAYSDTGLFDGTTYYYEVQAFNSTTTSGFSRVADTATLLAPPTGLRATVASATEIDLNWNDNSTTATGVIVERSTDDSGFNSIATLGSAATNYSNTGLSQGQIYYYFVEASTASEIATSAVVNATTIINAPSGLSATAISDGQINLAWTDNDGGAATAYDVDRSTTSTGGFTQIGTAGAAAAAYTDTGAFFPSTNYYYEVEAVTTNTTSVFSNIANATTPTNEVGNVATDYYYGTNNSSWNTQWASVTGALNHPTPSLTIQNNQWGRPCSPSDSGKTMSGNEAVMNKADPNRALWIPSRPCSSPPTPAGRFSNWWPAATYAGNHVLIPLKAYVGTVVVQPGVRPYGQRHEHLDQEVHAGVHHRPRHPV